MGVVGGFPGLSDRNRQTVRAPVNPMDKSTIVSIYPKEITERKYTIEPGLFHLEVGTFDQPAILNVGPSSWWKEMEEGQPLLEIPINSVTIAQSVVRDWANGLLACNMGDCMPGIFFLPGSFNQTEIKQKKVKELIEARDKQKNWYQVLVKLGDTLWARSNGNPLAISDDMRLAARELNLNNKEWTKDTVAVDLIRCIACGTLVQSFVIVCPNCKVILNEEQAKVLNLKFAQ